MGPAVGLGDPQIGQQERHGLGPHRRAPVGMNPQAAGLDVLLFAGLPDQLLGQGRRFRRGDHPAHHVAAEDVQDDVEVEIRPLHRAEELGNVPGPDLVRGRGQKLGLSLVMRKCTKNGHEKCTRFKGHSS
jgi:hypothetical protein